MNKTFLHNTLNMLITICWTKGQTVHKTTTKIKTGKHTDKDKQADSQSDTQKARKDGIGESKKKYLEDRKQYTRK